MGQFSHRNIEALFAASDIITLFVWENTEGWPVAYCSDNALKLLGYPKSMLERGEVRFIDKVHPEDLERVSKEVINATENPQITHFTHEDYRIVRATGEVIWISDTTVIERDENGRVVYLAGYLLNITERKRLELSLSAERNYLAQVIESARLSSWDWNIVDKSVRVNSHWLRLLELESQSNVLSEAEWLAYIHPDDRARQERSISSHLLGMQPYYEEVYRIQTARGRVRYVSDRGQIIKRDDNGKPLQISGIVTDITQHKEAELAAQKAAALKSHMLTQVSHEIRTPLHGILGLASLLERQSTDDKQRELLRTISESGDYLLRSLNDILEIVRAEHEDHTVNQQPTVTAEISRHLSTLFSESAKAKGLKLCLQLEQEVPEVIALDKSRFLQILINLIDNSIKYTESGEILVRFHWLSSDETQGILRVTIRDTGIGIQDVSHIWKLFAREHDDNERSSGVGLTVVEKLVKLLGGTISVDSAPQQGTEFKLELPASIISESTMEENIAPMPLANEHRKILLVDDSDINQMVLGEMLSNLGFDYISASSGEDALAVLSKTKIDLIFMDLFMAGLSGLETTALIRKEYGNILPVIGVTANPLSYEDSRLVSVGMNMLLTKPFTMAHIEQVLRKYLST